MKTLLEPTTLTYAVNALLLLLICSTPLLSVSALLHLRRQRIQGAELVLWVIIILFVPFLGALAYFITSRNRNSILIE